jgi:hypothetical protein
VEFKSTVSCEGGVIRFVGFYVPPRINFLFREPSVAVSPNFSRTALCA